MDILVKQLTEANEAYRNGKALLMTDEDYDAGLEQLARYVPHHPFLKKVRAAPVPSTQGQVVRLPYYLGSLDKAKVAEDLVKWQKRTSVATSVPTSYQTSEKLDGISGLWCPSAKKLYLSGDDNTGLDVSAWLRYVRLGPLAVAVDIPADVWIRGELILPKSQIPPGRLGRSIANGIFHHDVPDPIESAKVRFVGYEVMGMAPDLTVQQQTAWIQEWGIWSPWSHYSKTLPDAVALSNLLATRREQSEYDMDGLVIRTNQPQPRVTKGNPKDAIAWKPPTGDAKLTTVIAVEWNASANGRLVPRVQVEPVSIGGSNIQFVTGTHARRILDWGIGPSAKVILRKGGDVIPLIERVEVPAAVVFPKAGSWAWDGDEATAINIKQVSADTTTLTAQFIRIATKLDWPDIGPSQMKALVEAGHTTVKAVRALTEADLKKLLGPTKGSHFHRVIQTEGWQKATEVDLYTASPVALQGFGKTRLEQLQALEPDCTRWALPGLGVPKGWSQDSLKAFQVNWVAYEKFRKSEWDFLEYPRASVLQVVAPPTEKKGTVVFTGFRDADLESKLLSRGYEVVDAVKASTKAVLIADSKDPETFTSGKIEKAKKIPGCLILRKSDWERL